MTRTYTSRVDRAEARKMHNAGATVRTIAGCFGVTEAAVRYQLLPDEERERRNQRMLEQARMKRAEATAKLGAIGARGRNDPVNAEILRLRETTDLSYRAIAEHLNVTEKRVKYWCNDRERWRRGQERKRAQDRKAELINEARRKAAEARAVDYRRSRLKERLAKIRVSAKQRGLECTLDEVALDVVSSAGRCARTGIRFEPGDFDMSLDRVDNALGYTPNNVQAVCWIYNRAKGTSTDAAVLRMAVSLVQQTIVSTGLTFDELAASVAPTEWD